MGTTLENGVYLPSEGERNCYAGLKTNWEILDQKVADVTALQQAVAGALHREIVESLPTTDIDPNTIYMVLSGTSATENVYNEFMYVNNAWELIGTSATDLTNYYTKAEVDGKLLLKANASDLTSHTGDTTIHVTASDKNRWNNNTYVFRYSSTALTPSSTNSNTLLDNTDNLKVGDKVIDSSGVLFSITAIDTVNSTFTVGSALVDLAKDSDVVHKSGNETIDGVKSFINYFLGKDLSGQTVDLNDCVDAYSGAIHYYYAVSNYTNISNKPENKPFILESRTVRYVSSIDYTYYQKIYTADYNSAPSIYTRYYRSGSASWSNWVKDTDKFVTTDTNQTISGQKTFAVRPLIYNENATTQDKVPYLWFKNPLMERASTTLEGEQGIKFIGLSANNIASIIAKTYTSGTSDIILTSYSETSEREVRTTGVVIRRTPTTSKFHGYSDNITTLGDTNRRWSKVYAMSYYYGSDNVEFSNKFVTTDTVQVISGSKTFSSNVNVYNSDSATDTANIILKNSKVERGSTTNIGEQNISFVDKNNNQLGNIKCIANSSGVSNMYITCNVSGSDRGIRLSRSPSTTYFRSAFDNDCKLGTADVRWSDVQTYKVNNLNPSSLSLPDIDNRIDISSYITDLNNVNNEYTPTVNGWICVRSGNATKISILESATNIGNQSVSSTATYLTVMAPCIANKKVYINIVCTSLSHAYFIPCQGNV